MENDLRHAFEGVLAAGRFIGGDPVAGLERAFAITCGARHAVGVGSGTAAIAIGLRALGIQPGDEVVTAANTCVPTVAGIAAAGAVPVLADVDPLTLTIDPASVADAIGTRTRAIVPVHLYGRRAPMEPLLELARERGLVVLEDAAQAHGLTITGDAAAFSFYPTKNLGALGDAGAVVTSDEGVAAVAVKLREYGQTPDRVAHLRADQSRLDTLQAAILLAKVPHLERWNARRSAIAARYTQALRDSPVRLLADGGEHAHHLYVVRSDDRDGLRARLLERGVETLVHYPLAVHQHPAWRELGRPGALRESERAAAEVLSLPLYPQLDDDEVDAVIAAVAAG
ncbi:MAG: DegT/DnrJ/EryC1/StrS family aminotransferase [Gaiellaceae bacterium]